MSANHVAPGGWPDQMPIETCAPVDPFQHAERERAALDALAVLLLECSRRGFDRDPATQPMMQRARAAMSNLYGAIRP